MLETLKGKRGLNFANESLATRPHYMAAQPLRFVDSDEFENPRIVGDIQNERQRDQLAATPSVRPLRDSGTTTFIGMSEAPPLKPERETELFRRLNYLKYEACRLRVSLDPARPKRAQVDRIEQLLTEADEVRDELIRSNLRLVMSIAKRFAEESFLFEDLVSEGAIAVMNAVEHFDYQRGFRFSTYATQAVRRCFYRLLARRAKQRNAIGGAFAELLDSIPCSEPSNELSEKTVESLRVKVREILTVLDAREQSIIQARFGMKNLAPGQTLQRIADQLGVCKERVRQLEQRAMGKLRARAVELKLDEYLS